MFNYCYILKYYKNCLSHKYTGTRDKYVKAIVEEMV